LTESGEALKGKLSALEGRLINVDQDKPQPGRNRLEEKLVALSGLIDESDDAPTQGAREVLAKLHQQVQEQLDALRQLLDEDVPAFNRLVGELELPPVGA
jgi:ABC-type phosphate transport system auxiliary subunit